MLARRAGEKWYIAGINGENTAKELTIDLSLSGTSPSSMEVIGDGNGPRDLQHAVVDIKDGKLTIHMQPYGGFVGYWDKNR